MTFTRSATAFNVDSWGDPNANAPETIEATTYSQRLVNDGGSWSGTGTAVVSAVDGVDPNGAGMVTLTGEDGYEGLTMFYFQTGPLGEAFEGGVIVPSAEVPAFPEVPAE